MNYQDFLSTSAAEHRLPYFGGGKICNAKRTWKVKSPNLVPGWYRFEESGRFLEPKESIEPELDQWQNLGLGRSLKGYQTNGRFIGDMRQETLFDLPLDEDLERFTPIIVREWFDGHLLLEQVDFETETDIAVREAYEDEQPIATIKGVTPALANTYLFETTTRELAREAQRRREQQIALAKIAEENALREAEYIAQQASLEGRIAIALAHSGAHLISWRRSGRNQITVRYQVDHQRIECIIDAESLQVLDSGICLEGADTALNLSSLPSAVQEAIDTGQLHVYRQA